MTFLRDVAKYYIYFVDNSLLFTTVKEFEFQNGLTVDEVIAKIRHHVF